MKTGYNMQTLMVNAQSEQLECFEIKTFIKGEIHHFYI